MSHIMIMCPNSRSRSQLGISGQNTSPSAIAQKSTKANFIKTHRKREHRERICHAPNIGSDTPGQSHNQKSKVKSFPFSYQKTTVASVIKLYAKENSNEMIILLKVRFFCPRSGSQSAFRDQIHRRGKVLNIGGGGGARLRILGGKLFAGCKLCKLIGAPAPNQCQIITFFTLKTDIKAKLKTELKRIFLETPSNKIKCTGIKLVHL